MHWTFDVRCVGKTPGASEADCDFDPSRYPQTCDGCGCTAARTASPVGRLLLGLLASLGLLRRRERQAPQG